MGIKLDLIFKASNVQLNSDDEGVFAWNRFPDLAFDGSKYAVIVSASPQVVRFNNRWFALNSSLLVLYRSS